MVTSTGEDRLYARGFVFGKFYPLHLGHVAMIKFALGFCQRLDILVCCSTKEVVSPTVRSNWLRDEFRDYPNVCVVEYEYDESQLPNTSTSRRDVAKLWAEVFSALLPDVELLITSEEYGDYVAEYMDICHVSFDPGRTQVAISASAIREHLLGHWHYLPDPVKRHFQRTIVISGTESTGKTMLANLLCQHFSSVLVEEVGRLLIQSSTEFTLTDLKLVAQQHAEAINNARLTLAPIVFVDTDVYTTQGYANYAFHQQLNLAASIYATNRADFRLYLDANAPYVQDGTRLSKTQRNQLDVSHRYTLQKFSQTFSQVSGKDWASRSSSALEYVSSYVNTMFTISGDQNVSDAAN